MVLKHFFTAAICTMLLAWSGPSIADQYRPGDFLSLDLSKAVLSPKPLGPATQFAPFPVEAGADSDVAVPQSRAETGSRMPKAPPPLLGPSASFGRRRAASLNPSSTRLRSARPERADGVSGRRP